MAAILVQFFITKEDTYSSYALLSHSL